MFNSILDALDKSVITNIISFLVIMSYLAYIFIYPDRPVPEELKTIGNIVIGYLFTTAGISLGARVCSGDQ